MKKPIKNMLLALLTLLCTFLLLSVGIILEARDNATALPVYTIENEFGAQMQTVSIEDIRDCHKLTALNFVEGEYAHVARPEGVTYTNDALPSAGGTIQILISNLDPMASDYIERAEKLKWLTGADENYHLALYIPPIRHASNIYARAALVGMNGELTNYDFTDFYNRQEATETHVDGTEPLVIDLTMYANRRVLSADAPVNNGIFITIHYEAAEGKHASIDGEFRLGTPQAVNELANGRPTAFRILQTIAIAALAVLLFVSILKKSRKILPQTVFIVAIIGICSCAVNYLSVCKHPDLWIATGTFFTGLISMGGAMCVKKNIGKFPLRLCLVVAASLFTGMSIWEVVSPIAVGNVFVYIQKGLGISVAAFTIALVLLDIALGEKQIPSMGGVIAAIFSAVSIMGNFYLTPISPQFLLCAALLFINVFVSFREFVLTEQRNTYLTKNLRDEVDRQTEHLISIMNERDDLLRYLSHDLRKPIIKIRENLPLAIDGDERTRLSAISYVTNKLDGIENNLSEVSKYSQTSYSAEPSSVQNAGDILRKLYTDLAPDCEASGVELISNPHDIDIYAKPQLIQSILQNLVLNALDHGKCKSIELRVRKLDREQCLITVSDDGVGVRDTATMFRPYATDGEEDNLGLGLYLAKQFANSMGGNLTYSRVDNMSVFSVTLPLA